MNCIEGLSTKYIIKACPLFISKGCPQIKTNIFVLKMASIHGKCICEESVRTQGMGRGM